MPIQQFESYWQCINTIEAQEKLLDLSSHDWPNLKQDKRESFYRKLQREAYPVDDDRQPVARDLAQVLRGLNG